MFILTKGKFTFSYNWWVFSKNISFWHLTALINWEWSVTMQQGKNTVAKWRAKHKDTEKLQQKSFRLWSCSNNCYFLIIRKTLPGLISNSNFYLKNLEVRFSSSQNFLDGSHCFWFYADLSVAIKQARKWQLLYRFVCYIRYLNSLQLFLWVSLSPRCFEPLQLQFFRCFDKIINP